MERLNLPIQYIRHQPRWDFRYFEPKYLAAEQVIKNGNYPVQPLTKYLVEIENFGAYSLCNLLEWVEDGIPYVRVTDLNEDGINWSTVPHIPLHVHEQLPKSKIKPGDVLYSMAGTIGLAVVAPEDLGECNSNQAIAKIRVRSDELRPRYLAVFLNTEAGRYQSERIANGQTVLNINLGEIESLSIPIPTPSVQDSIANLMDDAFASRRNMLKEANDVLKSIDDYVLGRLGIDLAEIQSHKRAVKPIGELRTGRFDFEAVVTVREIDYSGIKATQLRDVVEAVDERITPVEDCPLDQINYVGLGNITSNTGELTSFKPVLGSTVLSASPRFKMGDILYGRMRPYLNKVWIAEFDGVCSGEVAVLRPNKKKVDMKFLHALLLSRITLIQIVPLQSGTSLPRVYTNDILNIRLPIPDDLELQRRIGAEVTERRYEAQRLRALAADVVSQARISVANMIFGQEQAI
jgi:hypothetical protein